jgi:hypothetical protein
MKHKFNLQSSIFNKIYNINRSIQLYLNKKKLLEILKKDRTWLKYELHCNVKTPAPLFFPNNFTFVIQMLINVFPRIVFVGTFFLHTSRESNNKYCFCLIIFVLIY